MKEDIRDSVAVGKIATVSQNNVTVGDWIGVGYIVSDPQTGSGAYRISGGSNGGSLTFTANAGGIIGLLVFTGLGMLTPIAKDLFPFKGDCGEEDIVKQLVLAAILIALIIVIVILISRQPLLAPVLAMLMTMLSEVVFADQPKKYISCPVLTSNDPGYRYISKFAVITELKVRYGPSIVLRPKGEHGDPASRGPCRVGNPNGYDVGEHWNVFGTLYATTPPAVVMCRCCAFNQERTEKRFAIK